MKAHVLKALLAALVLFLPMWSVAESPAVLLERGIYYQDTSGEIDKAIETYSEVIQANGEPSVSAMAYYRLGECYLAKDDREKAAAAFGDVLSKYPDQTEIVRRVGERMPELISVAANDVSAEAWQLWNQQRYKEASELFQKAVQQDAENANAWNGLGWSYFHLGERTKALQAFEEVLALAPNHAAALNGRGWIAYQLGREDEAIVWWDKAVVASPYATASLSGLANVYMERKQYDKAVDVYEKWLEVDPDNQQVKFGLEQARKMEGEGSHQGKAATQGTSAEAEIAGPLISYIEEKMEFVRERDASGNPWVDKNDLRPIGNETLKQQGSGPEALKAMEGLAKYAEQKKKEGDELYPWRLYDLAAYIAEENGMPAKANEYYLKALESYPKKIYGDPSKNSKFQHIVNAHAIVIWDQQGFDAALNYAAKRVATDPRMHYFFDNPWRGRIQRENGTSLQSTTLTNKIKEAYQARKSAFPDEASQIDRYMKQLGN